LATERERGADLGPVDLERGGSLGGGVSRMEVEKRGRRGCVCSLLESQRTETAMMEVMGMVKRSVWLLFVLSTYSIPSFVPNSASRSVKRLTKQATSNSKYTSRLQK